MPNSIVFLRTRCHVAVLMTLVLAGCDYFEESPLEPPAVEDATDGPALMAPGPVGSTGVTTERPGEATFVEITAAEPSFAGFFVEGDELVVLATSGAVGSTGGTDGGGGGPAGPGGGTPDSISSTGGDGSTGIPADVEASLRQLVSALPGHVVSSVSVRVAEYSFLQLSGWRELLESTIWGSDDVNSLDLDERLNRLTVELETGTGEAEIRAAARLLGVPDAALGFEVSGEISVASTKTDIVRSRVRPVRGGYYISTRIDDGCTYGFNAVRVTEGDTVAITNSHCTKNLFQVDGDSVWQKDVTYRGVGFTRDNFIGIEVSDPDPLPCRSRRATCRFKSRRSDAAALRLEILPDSIGLYQIARTTYRNRGTSLPGSFAVDPLNPYFTIHGEWPSPTAGNELNKIGVKTGWTYGAVIRTCVTVRPELSPGTRVRITCAYKMNARTDKGDSGAPVFYWDGSGDKVVLAGLVFAAETSSNKAWFSSMAAIEQDLGNLRTAAPGTPSKPDLTVSVSVDDNSVKPSGSFTLSATVENESDVGAAATTLTYYLSSDSTISMEDTPVGTATISALAAGGTSDESISLTAPSSEGTYYYGACVASVTGETDTSDNCSSAPTVAVTMALDLTVSSVSVSDSILEPGDGFTLSATVENEGAKGAAATTLTYYQSTDFTISAADTSVGTDTVSVLAAGGTSDESIPLTAPSSEGTYYYGACVASVTGEADTSDNCSSATRVDVEAIAPDLTVSVSVDDSSVGLGGSFTLTATVENEGEEAAAATTLRYYRSSDSTISMEDTPVGTATISALAAGGTSNESISLTAPAVTGIYYYGACVVSVTGESPTTNNCSSGEQVSIE